MKTKNSLLGIALNKFMMFCFQVYFDSTKGKALIGFNEIE